MASKMKSSFVNMVAILSAVALISGTSLGYVYELTKEPIAKSKAAKLKNAIGEVTPTFESQDFYMVRPLGFDGEVKTAKDSAKYFLTFYDVKNGDEVIATAVKSYTDKAFSGRLWLMVGFLPDGTIFNSNVLEHKETPGLGDKTDIKVNDWNIQFKQKNPANYSLVVKKDGGDVDAITAATISSRAYCDAMKRAYDTFMEYKQSNTQEVETVEIEQTDTIPPINEETVEVVNPDTLSQKEEGGAE